MGFAAAAPIIAAGVSTAGSAASSKGGGKGGGGGGSGGSSFQQTNFAPFQQPAINRVFDILGGDSDGESLLLGGTGRDSLLQVPPKASNALGNALDFANVLLGGDDAGSQGLLNFQSLINEELTGQPFNAPIDRFEEIASDAEDFFTPLFHRASALAEEGVNPRAGELLLETARGDFLNSNPHINALVEDVLTDVGNAALDQAGGAGLESPTLQQGALREKARAATQIRSNVFESERGRQESAKQGLAQFDMNNAVQKINSLVAGSNILSSRFNTELAAAQGIGNLTQADVQRRLNLIGQRGANEVALANLPLAGLNAVGPLASQFTQLPFVPLTSFAELAFSNLGGSRIALDQGSGGGKGGQSVFSNALSDGLKGLELGTALVGAVSGNNPNPTSQTIG